MTSSSVGPEAHSPGGDHGSEGDRSDGRGRSEGGLISLAESEFGSGPFEEVACGTAGKLFFGVGFVFVTTISGSVDSGGAGATVTGAAGNAKVGGDGNGRGEAAGTTIPP